MSGLGTGQLKSVGVYGSNLTDPRTSDVVPCNRTIFPTEDDDFTALGSAMDEHLMFLGFVVIQNSPSRVPVDLNPLPLGLVALENKTQVFPGRTQSG